MIKRNHLFLILVLSGLFISYSQNNTRGKQKNVLEKDRLHTSRSEKPFEETKKFSKLFYEELKSSNISLRNKKAVVEKEFILAYLELQKYEEKLELYKNVGSRAANKSSKKPNGEPKKNSVVEKEIYELEIEVKKARKRMESFQILKEDLSSHVIY